MVKVVLADDEEFVRAFLKSVLESLNFNVIAEVEKGDEVYDVMKKTSPDILLLDINMPKFTGMEFLQYYSHKFPKTCIIILTSATSFTLMEKASSAGASCFLRKDLPVEKMIEAINKTWVEFKRGHNINV